MGQALYRKYRTTSLAETAGQEHITKTLEHALKTGGISHAYLFTGPRGVGKTSLARILAHEVNGLPYSADSTHLDIIEIDAASNRRIDEIRELRDRIHVAPTSARYKVYIIDEVHMLTKEAFNALLKTLEEPPEHAIFILATTEAHKVPDTIISRTQRFTFRPYDEHVVAERLRYIAAHEHITIDDAAIELIAQTGGGSFRDSISLLDQVRHSKPPITADTIRQSLGIAPTEILQQMLKALQANPSEILEALSAARTHGYQSGQLAKQLIGYIRECIISGDNNSQALVGLMSSLIDVPTARDIDTALEVALISHAFGNNIQSQDTPAGAPVPAESPKKPPAQQVTPAPLAPPKDSTQPPEPKPSDPHKDMDTEKPKSQTMAAPSSTSQNQWPAVITAVKAKYNTLYGVLRMADVDWIGDAITLHFKFAFHQKRINEQRNKQLLIDVIKDVTGRTVTIDCVVGVSAASDSITTDAAEERSPSSTIAAVESIFGGAEVLPSE